MHFPFISFLFCFDSIRGSWFMCLYFNCSAFFGRPFFFVGFRRHHHHHHRSSSCGWSSALLLSVKWYESTTEFISNAINIYKSIDKMEMGARRRRRRKQNKTLSNLRVLTHYQWWTYYNESIEWDIGRWKKNEKKTMNHTKETKWTKNKKTNVMFCLVWFLHAIDKWEYK